MMRIVVFGDMFMRPEIVRDQLLNILSSFETEVTTVMWGFKGYQRNRIMGIKRELREFVGDSREVAKWVKQKNILVVHVAPVTKEVLDAGDTINLVACMRHGTVNIDVDAATEKGIPVINAPSRNATAVAEHTIGLMLAVSRNIARGHENMRKGKWYDDLYDFDLAGFELANKTLGLIGFGQVGVEVAKRCKAFEMKVIAYDPYVSPDSMRAHGVLPAEFEEVIRSSDILSIHARLTPETRHLLSAKEFRMMKKTAIVINTARGEIVDEQSLVKALEEGWISGAGLDTFEDEPLSPDHPLLKFENVVVTPHVAGASKETVYRTARMIGEDIKRFLTGQRPIHCVNPQVFDRK